MAQCLFLQQREVTSYALLLHSKPERFLFIREIKTVQGEGVRYFRAAMKGFSEEERH
jgi:hypothetical protein